MLMHVAKGGNLAEEVIRSVRNTYAFGAQKRVLNLYNSLNVLTTEPGVKSAITMAIGLSIIYFWSVAHLYNSSFPLS
jgi:hypothetical protein